jgi:hypothetical protein
MRKLGHSLADHSQPVRVHAAVSISPRGRGAFDGTPSARWPPAQFLDSYFRARFDIRKNVKSYALGPEFDTAGPSLRERATRAARYFARASARGHLRRNHASLGPSWNEIHHPEGENRGLAIRCPVTTRRVVRQVAQRSSASTCASVPNRAVPLRILQLRELSTLRRQIAHRTTVYGKRHFRFQLVYTNRRMSIRRPL